MGEREPACTCLQIDHIGLQAIRGRDHLLGAARVEGALVKADDCEEKDGEDDREPDGDRDR
jgi:hypothetical protein